MNEEARAQGYVDQIGKKWRARYKGIYLGMFRTEAMAWEAVDRAIAKAQGKEPDTCRALAKVWFVAREESGIVKLIEPQRSDWRSRVELPESKWLDMEPRQVRPKHLQRWLAALGKRNAMSAITRKVNGEKVIELRDTGRPLSHEAITKAVSLVKLFFDYARSEGKLDGAGLNPARGLIMPVRKKVARKGKQRIVHLIEAEIRALFALDMPLWVRAVYALAIYSGLRRAEIWGLRWENVDFRELEIRVRQSYADDCKTETSVRDVPMLPFAHECLHAYWGSLNPRPLTGYVFPKDGGGCHGRDYDCDWRHKQYTPMWTDENGVKHPVKKEKWKRGQSAVEGLRITPGWRSKAGIRPEVTFACLRHTAGCHLIQGTVLGNAERFDLKDVCNFLGHSSIRVTEKHYADLAPGNLADKAHGNVTRLPTSPVEKLRGK
jgi:integrase